jgi:hypothetical protein
MRVLNDISQARFDVQVEEAPWTPTQRDRAMALLSDMIQAEPDPVMRSALHEAAIMVGDIPYKAKVMEVVKNAQQAQMQAMQQAQAAQAAGPQMGPAGQAFPAGNPAEAAINPSPETIQTITNPDTAGMPLPNQTGGM